jgi:hypothetical protein
MKTIRKHIKFYSLLFATAILFYSFKDVDVIVEKTKINQQSGKEIFKSVFFALGDTANKIDVFKKQVETFNNFDANTKTEAYKQIDKLITEIDSKNPTYFDSFKSSIMSGNHLEIEKAIEEGGQKIYDHAPAVFPKFNQIVETVKKDIINDNVKIETVEDADQYMKSYTDKKYDELLEENMIYETNALCGPAIVCFVAVVFGVYFVLAVHNTIAGAANIYLVFALWGPKLDSPKKKSISHAKESSLLKKELLIDEIATLKW